MLERLFGIQYTGSLKVVGTEIVFGWYLDGNGTAIVHRITPTGNLPLGTTPVAFPHENSVRDYVASLPVSALVGKAI